MNKKLLFKAFILLELIFLVLVGIRAFKPNTLLNIPFDSWEKSSTDTNAIVSPYFFIDKGSYIANIEYSSDEDASVSVYSHGENAYNIKEYTTVLHSQKHFEQFEFEANGPVDNSQISIDFIENDTYDVQDISIYRTRNLEKRQFTIALFLIILINCFYIFRRQINANRKVILGIIVIGFLASIPLFSYGTEIGHDLDFHLMRIEGLRVELMAGHFPVRMQSYYNYGHGYPVSIYYGDILLYFPAFLRILGFQALTAYKIYSFSINLATTSLCYFAGKHIWNKDHIALLFSAAFTLSTYRFVDIYVRNAVGEYTAMMFFPLIALGVYEIYFNTPNTYIKTVNFRAVFYISVGMVGLLTCHILTTEMVCFFLIIFAIIFWKRTFSKPVITTILSSVAGTSLLGLWFIIPFLDYYLNVSVNINDTANGVAQIQADGAYITQYFTFFKSIFGTRSELITERMSVTPGLLLMCTLAISIGLWFCGYANKIIKRLIIASLAIMYISSNMFPWNIISNNIIGNILSQIQFPWRWLMFACLLMSFLLGYILDYIENNYDIAINKLVLYSSMIILLCIQIGVDSSSYANDAINIKCPKYSTDMDGTDFREYYLSGSDFFSLTHDVSGKSLVEGYLSNRNGSDFIFNIKTDKSGKVTLPILNYKGYKVWDEKGQTYRIYNNKQKEITIKLPDNFDGKIYVSFIEPVYWRFAEVVSILSFVLFIFIITKYSIKGNRV